MAVSRALNSNSNTANANGTQPYRNGALLRSMIQGIHFDGKEII